MGKKGWGPDRHNTYDKHQLGSSRRRSSRGNMPEEDEREKLARVIGEWNSNRLDLFEISAPDEHLDFHGVMRFYLEDHAGGNVATKCLRVCGSASTREVVETLAEKFRPDMKMLTTGYSLYEIHGSKERKLDVSERPLVVQLTWSADSREGRFALRKDKPSSRESCHETERGGMMQSFKRTLSRKDKTEQNKSKRADGSSGKPPNTSEEQRRTEDRLQTRPPAPDPAGLPIEIHLCGASEEAFLSAVISYGSSTAHFQLSPAYVLYAAGRAALRPAGGAAAVASAAHKMVSMTRSVIQTQRTAAAPLAFWMANSSELLNFFKNDRDVGPLTQQSQRDLSRLVREAFSCLLQSLQTELLKHLPTFVAEPEASGCAAETLLDTLSSTMSLLRRCRANAALTIQLFSQLFHFISAWLFNRLMGPEASTPGLRSHYWGAALRRRLAAVEAWAERHGLELAADCHLGHIVQATTVLTMNKYSIHDAKDIQNVSFKLNSLQLQTLLCRYLCAAAEPRIPADLISAVVAAAQASVDHLIRSEGRDVQLEESLDLHLPFLLPEGGYSCDTVRGIPPGLREFLEPICQKGLCSLTRRTNSNGDWTACFHEATPSAESTHLAAHSEPEVVSITLNKPLNSGMGVSIVAAKGAGQDHLGIYIKSIVKGGPAEMNGRLTAGDQLLRVDGLSLIGLSQERAAAIMTHTGPVVTLQVAKLAASYHGLGAVLSQPALEGPAGGRGCALPNTLADPAAPEQLGQGSRRKTEPATQRHGQLYRSNPDMSTATSLVDGEELTGPAFVTGNNIAAVSSINLCNDTFCREYLTLPTPKSQDRNISDRSQPLSALDGRSCKRKTVIRQALSQENLCMDSGGPLLDKGKNTDDWSTMQTMRRYSCFPIRPSVSSHDILSDTRAPTKQQQGPRTSGAGTWRTPISQHPTPSIQPLRIDIPATRAVKPQLKPPLTTFQTGQGLKVNAHSQSPQTQDNIYACPITAGKKLPQPLLSSQQQRSSALRGQVIKPPASLSPVKHVSFQEPPTQQKKGTSSGKQQEPQGLCDPWRREAQEKLEKQQRLHVVELLQQEVEELQAIAKRSAEENGRLRKLNLEWQFQKRLQEIQQGGEDEEDDEDEDLDMMVMLQQLDTRAQTTKTSGHISCDLKGLEKREATHLSLTEENTKSDQSSSGRTGDVQKKASRGLQEERARRAPAPETLTFKERQRLFSLASSA